MKPSNVRSRRVRLVAAAATVLVLSACGNKSLDGVAADVGNDVITDKQVDEFASLLCSLQGSGSGSSAATATRPLRSQALAILLDIEVASQVGDFDTVDPTLLDQYVQQSSSARDAVPDGLKPVFDKTISDYGKAQLALADAGKASLEKQGTTSIDTATAVGEGDKLRVEFIKTHDVTVDPRFGVMKDGALTYQDGSLSTAVSKFAVGGDSDKPAQPFVDSLPASQLCS